VSPSITRSCPRKRGPPAGGLRPPAPMPQRMCCMGLHACGPPC
jgi:hypothetical protein